MAGAPAPIDAIFEQIRKIREQLLKLGPQVGGANPLTALSDPALLDLWRALRQDAATLPPPVNTLVTQIAQHAGGSVSSDATSELERAVSGRGGGAMPRASRRAAIHLAAASEMPLADFGDVFGYGGLFDKFFTDNLEKLVDTSQRPWTWRPESVAAVTPAMLRAIRTGGAHSPDVLQSRLEDAASSPSSLQLSNLDAAATRFYVNIDGQRFDVEARRREPRCRWCGPVRKARASRSPTFEDQVAAPEQAIGFEGPWAWFRLIDAAKARTDAAQPDSDLVSDAPLSDEIPPAPRSRSRRRTPASNPFASRDWRQFRCEP